MTEAEWNLINGTLVHLKQSVDNCESCHLDMDYTFIKEIVENNKPFEIEVGKKYIAKFDMYCMDYVGEHGLTIRKGSSVNVFELGNEECCFEHNDSYCSMTKDQFKACFKQKEDTQ